MLQPSWRRERWVSLSQVGLHSESKILSTNKQTQTLLRSLPLQNVAHTRGKIRVFSCWQACRFMCVSAGVAGAVPSLASWVSFPMKTVHVSTSSRNWRHGLNPSPPACWLASLGASFSSCLWDERVRDASLAGFGQATVSWCRQTIPQQFRIRTTKGLFI